MADWRASFFPHVYFQMWSKCYDTAPTVDDLNGAISDYFSRNVSDDSLSIQITWPTSVLSVWLITKLVRKSSNFDTQTTFKMKGASWCFQTEVIKIWRLGGIYDISLGRRWRKLQHRPTIKYNHPRSCTVTSIWPTMVNLAAITGAGADTCEIWKQR